jgi:hypothetical protein
MLPALLRRLFLGGHTNVVVGYGFPGRADVVAFQILNGERARVRERASLERLHALSDVVHHACTGGPVRHLEADAISRASAQLCRVGRCTRCSSETSSASYSHPTICSTKRPLRAAADGDDPFFFCRGACLTLPPLYSGATAAAPPVKAISASDNKHTPCAAGDHVQCHTG